MSLLLIELAARWQHALARVRVSCNNRVSCVAAARHIVRARASLRHRARSDVSTRYIVK